MSQPASGQTWLWKRSTARSAPTPGSSYWSLSWVLGEPGPRAGDWWGSNAQGRKLLRREWFTDGTLELRR